MIKEILKEKKHLFLNADDGTLRRLLSAPDAFQLKQIIGDETIVFIDEAQRGYEFKWKDDGRIKIPKAFIEGYQAKGTVISRENFRSFLLKRNEGQVQL